MRAAIKQDYKNCKTSFVKIKIEKTAKIGVKLLHVNKKPLPRNRIFDQTPFSHSTLKLEQKNSRRKTTRFSSFGTTTPI